MDFGLNGNKLGVFLLLVNMSLLGLCFYFAWNTFKKHLEESTLKEMKVIFIHTRLQTNVYYVFYQA